MGQGVNQITQNATKKASRQASTLSANQKTKATESLNAALALQEATNANWSRRGTYQGRFADWQTAGAALASAIPALTNWLTRKNQHNSQVASKHLCRTGVRAHQSAWREPSNADRDFIMKTIPMLTNDPAAFTRLTNYVQSMSLPRAVDVITPPLTACMRPKGYRLI